MSTETIVRHPGAFIAGGEHTNGGDPLPITNPGTGEVFAAVPGGTAADVDAAVGAAAAAMPQW
jgi:aldehyde dehydrogenase (NAD+)